jgi:hypothetical protein
MNYCTTKEHYNHILVKKDQTHTNSTNTLENSQKTNQDQKQDQNTKQKQVLRNPPPTYKSTTHQFLGAIAALAPHQEPPKTTTQQPILSQKAREIQNTVALLLLHKNNHPRTQWPQEPAQSLPPPPPPLLANLPAIPDLEDLEVEEGLAALQEVLPLNNELVQQWPQLFDELEEEEVGAILCLEAEEVVELLEAEAQQHLRTPLKSQSSQQPTSKPWEPLPKPSTEIEDKQETS